MPDKPPIAITGMHRSGTSMITRALHESGLRLVGTDGDELLEPAEDNPEGFWENKAIVACNDELLEAVGGAWDNPPVLPPVAVDDPRVAHVAEAATAALAPLREHDHWGFKDPRTCLTAAYWLDLEADLRFIICVRHPVEVAMSLKRRNQNSYSLGLALWERYYATLLEHVSPERRIVTHYDTFFLDPEAEMARVCAFAGLEPAPPPVRRDLRHHATDVELGDAGASGGLQSLYDRLCREGGAPPPRRAPADAGRVRRLILDGAVAQRHADQRQAAIERLQAREDEFRAAHARAEADLRSRIRALEDEVMAARLEALETTTARALDELSSAVDQIDRRTRDTAARLEARPVRDTAARAARAGARWLPASAQHALRTNRERARRLAAQPGPTARSVQQRLRRQAGVHSRLLPPPAQQALRRGRSAYRRAAAAPLPTAKAGVRRLPDPAQRAARGAWLVAEPLRRAGARYIAARRLGARSVGDPPPRPRATPKGPAPRLWSEAYRQLVQQGWSDPEPWLVVSPGSPHDVAQARRPRATPFPDTRGGKPLVDDLAHIAHLEAQRYAGHRHLVLPEGSRPWFRQQTELRDHVVRTYRTTADEPDAGAVFDLGQAPGPGLRSLLAAVEHLATGPRQPLAVLDCTSVDLGPELPGHATFSPPATSGRLPYLDGSVDVVVLDADHDLAEARRVAGLGVVTVAVSEAGPVVRSVDGRARPAVPRPRVLVWSSPVPDPRWEPALADRVERAGAHLLVAPLDADHLDGVDHHDVVVAVEPHALPLPGTIEAAAAATLADPGTAVAGKVLQPDGRLESAGGTVFFDRSVALIAASSLHVRAPWLDYVRPVCWAPGLIAAAAGLWAGIPGPAALEGRAYLREWCATLWASGHGVAYHPDVTAVRVDGDGGEPSVPLTSSAWQRVLDLRPHRPRQLSDGAWRHLLAHDDVEACRG